MYMNRLRDDDFKLMFKELKSQILYEEKNVKESLLKLLKEKNKSEFINQEFLNKDIECLATTSNWIALKF